MPQNFKWMYIAPELDGETTFYNMLNSILWSYCMGS